jgi:hypothetical protein
MPDERSRFGRFDQRNESRSCKTEGHRPPHGCPACASRELGPFRAVKRYRGDQVVRAFTPADWCDVWQLQAGDISWPKSRRG